MNLIPPFKKLFCDKSHREDGFTLIEVLVSLTIFAIGLLALAGMQVTGIQGNSRAQSVSAKVALADGVIEEFLAMDGDDPFLERTDTVDGNENWLWVIDPDDLDDDGSTTSIQIAGAGVCSAKVTVDADLSIDGLTNIDVTASSTTGSDVLKTVMKRRY